MMKKSNQTVRKFLINAILLTLATIMVGVFMPTWGVAQIVVIAIMALISAFQWGLWVVMRKM